MPRACALQCCWTSLTSRVSRPHSGVIRSPAFLLVSIGHKEPVHAIQHGNMRII